MLCLSQTNTKYDATNSTKTKLCQKWSIWRHKNERDKRSGKENSFLWRHMDHFHTFWSLSITNVLKSPKSLLLFWRFLCVTILPWQSLCYVRGVDPSHGDGHLRDGSIPLLLTSLSIFLYAFSIFIFTYNQGHLFSQLIPFEIENWIFWWLRVGIKLFFLM